MFKIASIFLLVFFIFSSSVFALSTGPGARAAAMGGAYSAIASGAESLWWNPAGLAKSGPGSFDFSLGLASTISYNEFVDVYNQLKTANGRTTYLNSKIFEPLNITTSAHLPLGFSMKNIAVGVWADGFASIQKTANSVLATGLLDAIVRGGVGYGLSFDKWSFGGMLNYYVGGKRNILYSPFLNVNLALEEAGDFTGLGLNLGLKYDIADNSAVTLVIENFLDGYTINKNTNARDANGNVTNLASATTSDRNEIVYVLGGSHKIESIALLTSADIRAYSTIDGDINSSGVTNKESVIDYHLGMEKEIGPLALRLGYATVNKYKISTTWLTYGLGLRGGSWVLNLAAGNSSKGATQLFLETSIGI